MKLFGRSLDWEAAYGPLHKKLGVGAGGTTSISREAANIEEKEGLLTEDGNLVDSPPPTKHSKSGGEDGGHTV
jgi:hypothetical protein